jgi:hypothetical protein
MFNPFKSLDKYFLSCKLLTLLFCLPWPLTLAASVMSLAGQFRSNTPTWERILVRLGWLLALVYPVVFLMIVVFSEKVLARRSYLLGVLTAALPIAFSILVIAWFFRN